MRNNYYKINPSAIDTILAADQHLKAIDERLKTLIELRVSQINGCAFCVDRHMKEARKLGENQQKLDCLSVWEDSPFFDERERAALAWAESVTNIRETHTPDEEYNLLKPHFSEQEIVDLTLTISLMNTWNRIAVSFRKPPSSHP